MKQETSILEKIVSALALLIVGVCLVVWADKVTEWIAIALGVMSLITATVHAAKYLQAKPGNRTPFSLFIVVILAAVGVMLVSRADFIKEAISFIIGIYIIFSCAAQLMALSALRRQNIATKSYFWPVAGIIIGIFCITGKFIVPDALATITGIALIIYSIVYLAGLVTIGRIIKAEASKTPKKKIAGAVIVKEAEEAEVKTKSKK